jgi:hypothetical protein
VIPELTAEQRREAAAKSLELRRARAQTKRLLAAGSWTLAAVFELRDEAQGMKVIDLLMALPGIGMRKALALLQQAGIPSHNTVRACGPKQTERFFLRSYAKPLPSLSIVSAPCCSCRVAYRSA